MVKIKLNQKQLTIGNKIVNSITITKKDNKYEIRYFIFNGKTNIRRTLHSKTLKYSGIKMHGGRSIDNSIAKFAENKKGNYVNYYIY